MIEVFMMLESRLVYVLISLPWFINSVSDNTVDPEFRGGYLAFTSQVIFICVWLIIFNDDLENDKLQKKKKPIILDGCFDVDSSRTPWWLQSPCV